MEKLKADQQKEIIKDLVNILANEDPNLYYTESSTIATLVHDMIQNQNSLNKEKFELVKDLSSDDVLILLSYKSNCC
jgi:hypothetical protein